MYISNLRLTHNVQLFISFYFDAQLESQRDFFEGKLARMEESASREMMEFTARAKFAQQEKVKLEKELGRPLICHLFVYLLQKPGDPHFCWRFRKQAHLIHIK